MGVTVVVVCYYYHYFQYTIHKSSITRKHAMLDSIAPPPKANSNLRAKEKSPHKHCACAQWPPSACETCARPGRPDLCSIEKRVDSIKLHCVIDMEDWRIVSFVLLTVITGTLR